MAWGFGGGRESSGRATLTEAVVGTGHESVSGVVGWASRLTSGVESIAEHRARSLADALRT